MKIGIASDHGGFELKQFLLHRLSAMKFNIVDYGNYTLDSDDDYPDFVIPMAKAVGKGEIDKGIAVCGSGVGASIAANKIEGVRAALINDHFAAHQGVEDDAMNIICLGGRITGAETAIELVLAFLNAEFSYGERHIRRLKKADPAGTGFLE